MSIGGTINMRLMGVESVQGTAGSVDAYTHVINTLNAIYGTAGHTVRPAKDPVVDYERVSIREWGAYSSGAIATGFRGLADYLESRNVYADDILSVQFTQDAGWTIRLIMLEPQEDDD